MHIITKAILGATVQFQSGKVKRNSSLQKNMTKNLRTFKCNNNDAEFYGIFGELNTSKLGRGYINGNFFPKTIENISKGGELEFSGDLNIEFRWYSKIFFEYSEYINDFVKTKKSIEKLILLEKYQEALSYLVEFQEKYGLSIWLFQNIMYIYTKLEVDIDNEILSQCNEEGPISTILAYYKLQNDPNVGSRDYEYIVRRELQEFIRRNPNGGDYVIFYQYILGTFNFVYSEENIATLIKAMYKMPLFDRYLMFTDICANLVALKSENISIIKKYIKYLAVIDDEVLKSICFAIDDIIPYHIDDELLSVKNTFIEGNLPECLEVLAKYINNNPDNMEAICFYARVISTMQLKEKEFSDTVNMIINSISIIFQMNKSYEDEIEKLYKLLISCSKAKWAKSLNAEIIKNCNPFSEKLYQHSKILSSFYIESCEKIFILKNNDWINANYLMCNKYIQFRKALKEDNFLEAKRLCAFVPLEDIVCTIEACKHNNYVNLKFNYSENAFSSFEIIKINIFLNRLDIDEYAILGIQFFVDSFLKNKMIALFMPMEKYIGYCDELEVEDRSNLTMIIFYYIYINFFNINRKDDLVFLCEVFLNENNISKPSKMDIYSEKYNINQVLFFLKNVCTQTILGPILINMKTTKELDEERLEICQLLRSIDSNEEKSYEQEIKDITQKLFINEGVQTLQNSKIEVNTEGIKTRIISEVKEDFQRLILYRSFQMDKILEVLGDYQKQMRIINFDSNQLFKDIIIKIRDAFVSGNEYGLEGNLSMNIRHGTLAEQLRRPLLNANLFAVYNNKIGSFVLSEKIKYPHKMKNVIINIIGQLNTETEEIINYLKKELIQVNTEEKPTNGIFDYSMSKDDFSYLLLFLKEEMEFEEYLEIVFTYLWELTEKNLDNIKKEIKVVISEKYNKAFDNARLQLASVDRKRNCADLVKRINEAEIELQNELTTICDWFKKSENNIYKDFDLNISFKIALKMIENVHPNKRFRAICIEESSDKAIKGRFLKNYCDIFYTLFDNVNAYAEPNMGTIEIRYKLFLNNGFLEIYMENAYNCYKNNDIQREKMNYAKGLSVNKEYLLKAKTEGGSGIPKICKIINVDLYKKPFIDLDIDEEKNIFYITIKGEASGKV